MEARPRYPVTADFGYLGLGPAEGPPREKGLSPESADSGYPASDQPGPGGEGGWGLKKVGGEVLRIGFAWCGKCSHTLEEY